jgi:predicted Zn-dependent protease
MKIFTRFLAVFLFFCGFFLFDGCGRSKNGDVCLTFGIPEQLGPSSANFFTVEEDIRNGDEIFRNFSENYIFSGLKRSNIARDAQIEKYLNGLVEKLVPFLPEYGKVFNYRVYCFDDSRKNLYALGGGIILVSFGYLAEARSEDQLVSALGHEIGHTALRHRSAVLTEKELISLEKKIIEEAYASVSSGWFGDKSRKDKIKLLLERLERREDEDLPFFIKMNEFEADIFSARVAMKAGFNPIDDVNDMLEDSKKEKEAEGTIFMIDHPPSRIRAQVIKNEMHDFGFEKLRKPQTPRDFLAVREKARNFLLKN